MAVSGSKNFTLTRADLIAASLRKVGAGDSGETPDAGEGADAAFALNLMVKEWSARGIDLPWRETITVFLQPNQQSYRIGLTGDHATTSYVETTLATDEALGSTSLGLTSTTGMTNADHIGVKLDDGTIHWTTISNVAGTTIVTGLASAASAGNAVYAYTTKAYRPQRIVYVHRREGTIDTNVELIGEVAYRGLSSKGSAGPVNQVYYQPTLTDGTLYVWPANYRGSDKLLLIAQNLVDDFDAAGDNPQFPIEWANALIWNLAYELAPEYGISLKERMILRSEASEKLETVMNSDVENASLIIGMEVQ
jgi:hypothetical protein